MKHVYIHSAAAISAQETFASGGFLDEIQLQDGKQWKAIHPNYKEFIPPVASRRMSTGVKMAIACAKKALNNAGIENPDAIITGTGMGCIEDTEKFLNSIIENDEEFLTPTSFIQSTHNTFGSQIALGLKCKAYNNTYSHASNSFESALMDAQMLIIENEVENVLVGGVDELGKEFVNHVQMMEEQSENGINVPFGEGASFLVLSNIKSSTGIRLMDVDCFHKIDENKISTKIEEFLIQNDVKKTDINALILGENGDEFDGYYENISSLFGAELSKLNYKHLVGEYFTALAFGFWLGYKVLERQVIPDSVIDIKVEGEKIKHVLLYNQFKGRDHSFVLLSK